MSDSDTIKTGKEPGFRRFSDKLLYGACATTITLVGLVWSLTWLQTEAVAAAAIRKAGEVDAVQQKHNERIIRLEVYQGQTADELKAIKADVHHVQGKIDAAQQTLNQVLLELRKGGK